MSEVFIPLTLELIAICPDMNAVTFSFAIDPLAYVRFLTIRTTPDTISLLHPLVPLSVINFTICPGVDSFFVWPASLIFTLVGA
jgi:hypothetical protein